MNPFIRPFLLFPLFAASISLGAPANPVIHQELDAYWAEVSRCVGEGDFEGYSALFHDDAVLVSGIRGNSEPISQALARWKKGINATKAGTIQASVEIRTGQRFVSTTTAHETGIFLYKESGKDREPVEDYIHYEALLVKQGCQWLITMEYQKSKATVDEWQALAK